MLRRLAPLLASASVIAASLLLAGHADAKARKKSQIRFHRDWAKHPSAQYAALTPAKCTEELTRRGVEFTPVKNAPGVLAPVRLPKDVGGVVYRTQAAPYLRSQSPYDVFDCRLVLSLSDFSKILRAHDVEEVLMFSAWRPPSPKWPEGKLGTRHSGALAIDAFRFGKKLAAGQKEKERVWLDVQRDWVGAIGAPSCGPGAPPPRPKDPAGEPPARELRAIACEAADQHIFTSILTPNYDRAHHNHFHLEVTPDVTWHLVR